jgi:hypothetical protein
MPRNICEGAEEDLFLGPPKRKKSKKNVQEEPEQVRSMKFKFRKIKELLRVSLFIPKPYLNPAKL